jgi:hypothetical protein
LIFISVGAYTVLTSCTNGISKTYKRVCDESNLHDFTVNELYKTSQPVFELYDTAKIVDGETPKDEWQSMGLSFDNYPVP